MKKLGLIVIGLALLPFQAFADDLSPADCLVLESMIDLPPVSNAKESGTATGNAFGRPLPMNETPEQRLERKKEEYAQRDKERQTLRAELQKLSKEAEQNDKINQARISHLSDVFAQNACGDKIKSINDQMGCLAIDLTIGQLTPMLYGFNSIRAEKMPSKHRVNMNETAIEKEIRELEEKNNSEEEKFENESNAEFAKTEARQLREEKRVKDRLQLLKDTSKNNCKSQFSDLPEKVK